MSVYIDSKSANGKQVIIKRSEIEKIIKPDHQAAEDGGPQVCIKARVVLRIPLGGVVCCLQPVETPGLWGVDEASGHSEYGDGVFKEECATLEVMLERLHVKIID